VDESYGFDANGNRNTSGYTTATNNRTTAAPGFTFTYDDEGNRTSKTETATGKVTEYTWDYRNRLTTVRDRNTAGGAVVKQVDYQYDAFNRLVRRTFDADGAGAGSATNQYWVYDSGINTVLQFDGSAASNVSHRYLWSDNVDEIIANEQIGSDTLYGLGDHLGTIRDIANFNEGTGLTSVTNHRKYDSFGKLVSESNSAVDLIFGFTGKQLDEATGLQHNLFRWYDSALGQWLSEDPIGFAAGDENVKRYVANKVLDLTDPSGLDPWLFPWDPNASWNPRDTLHLWFTHTPEEHLRGLYTTDTDIMPWTDSALEEAGGSVTENPAREVLRTGADIDPTPIFPIINEIINGGIEGKPIEDIFVDSVVEVLPGPGGRRSRTGGPSVNPGVVPNRGPAVFPERPPASPALPDSPFSPREVNKRQSELRRQLETGCEDPDSPIPDQRPGRDVGGHEAKEGTPHVTGERNVNSKEEHSRVPKGPRGPRRR
jgi:RHS repeat-associated protein